MKTTPALIALLLAALTLSAPAKFMAPELVPVDRLVKNAEAYLATHQSEADAHYTLARIHYLAFSMKRDQVPAFVRGVGEGGKPQPAPDWQAAWARTPDDQKPAEPAPSQMAAHASAALRSFQEAMRLDPQNGLHALGLASLLEEVCKWQETARPEKLPDSLQGITIRRARDAYAKAFDLALPADAKIASVPVMGVRGITAHEAGQAFIRLAQNVQDPLTAEEKKNLEQVRTAVAKMEKLPMGPITPVVFSYRPAAHLAEHLAPETTVDFDLRGYGVRERWPWVKPELGFLVWDPLRDGRIQSARQMFGGYTFQIFRKTGYDALSALDDNADGQLSGAELEGISVWFDRDSDGRAAAGEVTPVEQTDIAAIAVTAESRDGIHPTNPRGITLRDGRTLPTWDWIVAPASGPPAIRP